MALKEEEVEGLAATVGDQQPSVHEGLVHGEAVHVDVGQAQGQLDEEAWLLEGAPEHLVCPVSFVLMRDPVLAPDGHTYQREALQQCIDYARQREWGGLGWTCSV
jgi:hypothetical protein